MKKILLGFEKKVSRNQEMRIKFPDQPDKFMMSEMELHDGVRELQNVSTVPHMYPVLVELNCASTLLGLLGHDNTDIAVAAVEVIQELTDVDTMNESEEGAEVLIKAGVNILPKFKAPFLILLNSLSFYFLAKY